MVAEAIATIALGLLGVGGVAKVVDPDLTSGALRAARLPSSTFVVRLLGFGEVVAAVAALVFGAFAVLPAALMYSAFTLFTWAAVRGNIPLQTCGCFGRDDTPPTWFHVGYNLMASLALLMVIQAAGSPIPWSAPVAEVILYVTFAALGTYASLLLLTALPQVRSAAAPL